MRKQRPVIWMISSWYPGKKNPSRGIFVQRHAKAISGYCDVVFFVADASLPEDSISNLNGYTEVRFPFKRSSLPLLGLLVDLFRLRKALFTVSEKFLNSGKRPDLVHGHVLWPLGILAREWAERLNVPFVFTEHWTGYLPEDGTYEVFPRPLFIKRSVKNCSAIFPVTGHLAGAMEKRGVVAPFKVIPNVVETELFVPAKEKLPQFTFIHVSAFDDRQKNITGLLSAFEHVLEVNPGCKLMLVGSGADFERIKEVISAGKTFRDAVSLTGNLEPADLARHLGKAHCLVMNSRFENLPCVILEAFSCGVPVISTDVGGIREFFPDFAGILVKPGDQKGLTDAMNSMIHTLSGDVADKLVSYSRQKFSFDVVGKAYFNAYNDIIHDREAV